MREQIEILSIPVDVVTMEDAVKRAEGFLHEKGLHMIATANAEMIMCARDNARLKKALQSAALVVPDGAGALWAAERLGKRFPERVAGVDLAKALVALAVKQHIPIYCLGAAPGVIEKAMDNLALEFGPIPIVGMHDGYFDEAKEQDILQDITNSGAKCIMVALGVPRQELWIQEKLSHLSGVVAIGLGGSFDVLSGNLERAPKWMQEARLEWLYRLCRQPSRCKRMLAIPKFMLAVNRDVKRRENKR